MGSVAADSSESEQPITVLITGFAVSRVPSAMPPHQRTWKLFEMLPANQYLTTHPKLFINHS
jgi:hypothetical protein